MKITNLSSKYKFVGSYGNASDFKRRHKHLMKAFKGTGYTIAVHQTDELCYKFSEIENEQIDEIIVSPFNDFGVINILAERDKSDTTYDYLNKGEQE